MSKKVVKFMDTSFRDGFQSVFGARVYTKDFLPALQATIDAGITHLEAGGGARFQSLFFYCNESAFDMMDAVRETAGPEANLQTLARGINVVALHQQPRDIIDLHAKLFKKHGITTIRNFDALNDIRNLKYSGERISHHGLKHQVVITIMELPPGCQGAHTTEFYLERLQKLLAAEIPFDSICFKDATGTANPGKVHDTFKGARKLCPADTVLWFHTHDTAGIGVAQNLAAIEGGADGIDLSKSPVSGGTAQPDIMSMVQVLKDSDYQLDVDIEKVMIAEDVFEDAMDLYFYPPESKMVSPKIIFSPMPGGALTANTMMMRDTNTLYLYGKVIDEMADVVKLGGFGSSVTPVSQFYFQQAYLNVTLGSWKQINPNYGNMVLGYFGKTPVEPDAEVVKLASEQLGKPVFKDDPLDLLDPGIPKAEKILRENGLPINEETVFIIASCEGKGLDFLLGNAKSTVRKREPESSEQPVRIKVTKSPGRVVGQTQYDVSMTDRSYSLTVGSNQHGQPQPQSHPAPLTNNRQTVQATAALPSAQPHTNNGSSPAAPNPGTSKGIPVTAQIPGKILKVSVKVGDEVANQQTLLIMEAMKMETAVKAPKAGNVLAVHVAENDAVQTAATLVVLS